MKQVQTRAQRQPNIENNTQSQKIRIVSVTPIQKIKPTNTPIHQEPLYRQFTPESSIHNQQKNRDNLLSVAPIQIKPTNTPNHQEPLYRQFTPESSIHNQQNNPSSQQTKNRNYLAQNVINKKQNDSSNEQNLYQGKIKQEIFNTYYPSNKLPPKQQTIQQNTIYKTPQDQQNYVQEKKLNHIQTIQPKKSVLIESNFSMESEKSQEIQSTKETDIDMYASIMIEQKMNCKSCCFIIDQDAFVTTCQHTFHYNCLRDSINYQLNNGQYNIFCVCQTKLSQNLIKNLQAVLKENFFEKLILNQIKSMKVQYQPFIAECGKCQYFCIEFGNPKSKIGDYAQYICPNCTKRN